MQCWTATVTRTARKSTDLSSKKQIYTCSPFLYISLPLFGTTAMPFCTTKGGIAVCAHQKSCCLCSWSLVFFSLPLIFTLLASPCWPRAFLIFLPPLWNFHVFFQQNSSPFFLITRSSSFSVIHVSENIEKLRWKRLDFVVVFSL